MLDQLKNVLAQEPGQHIPAKQYLNEAVRWLEHIETLEANYGEELDLGKRMFILNDVTMNYCSILNWSAVIWYLKGLVTIRQMADFITQQFCWPPHVSEAFMNCIRNPTAHMGRATMFGEYEAKWKLNEEEHGDEYTFTGAFDQNIDPEYAMPPKEAPFYEEVRVRVYERGYYERPEQTPPDIPKIMKLTFYFPAFKELVQKAVLETFEKVKGLNDQDRTKFEDLRNKYTITRVPAPENGG